MADNIEIRLEVYLPFRGRRLGRGVELVPAGTTAAGRLAHLDLQEPELAVLVGGRSVAPETLLRSGDEVAILRHAEGG